MTSSQFKIGLSLLILGVCFDSAAGQISVSVADTTILFQGEEVSARVLTVSSMIPMGIDTVWENVRRPELLEYVAAGKFSFHPEGGTFPEVWEEGQTVRTKMKFWGWIPVGGIHVLEVQEINRDRWRIQTREYDRMVNVWDHQIRLKPVGDHQTHYTDEIIIYAKGRTGLVTRFASNFYQHRQERWQEVAEEKLIFFDREPSGLEDQSL